MFYSLVGIVVCGITCVIITYVPCSEINNSNFVDSQISIILSYNEIKIPYPNNKFLSSLYIIFKIDFCQWNKHFSHINNLINCNLSYKQ